MSGKLHKQTAAFFIQTQDGKCSGFVFDSVLLFPFPFSLAVRHAAFTTLTDRAVHVLRQFQQLNQICELFHGK